MQTHRKPIIADSGLNQITLGYEIGMKSDFSDIRFMSDDGVTELDYKRTSYISGDNADFIVNADGTQIWSYFGDNTLTYTSTWEPTEIVIQEIECEKGYEKNVNNPIIAPGTSGQWDDYFIYSIAPIEVSGTTYLFYSGNRNEGANPKHEGSIGLVTTTDHSTFTKQGMIIDKDDIDGLGLAPFCVIEIDGTYYMFVTTFHSGGSVYKSGYLTSTDLYNWSGFTYLTGIDSANHAPFVMEDPDDADKLIMFYSGDMLGTPCIKRVSADKTDPSTWTGNTTVMSGRSLYPWVNFTGTHYEMYVSKQLSGGGYSTYKTVSKDGLFFPFSTDLKIIENGGSGEWDESYITVPRVLGDKLYYTARKVGVQGYQGVGMATLTDNGVLDWGWSTGVVGSQDTYVKSGTYAGKLVGGSNTPAILSTSQGKATYEVWVYDDLNTSSGHQNTFRLWDSATNPDLLVGIYTVTSTSKYIYRKKGGSWSVSSINRSLGWHKLTYVVGDDVKAYIDDQLIFTDTVFNTNDLQWIGLFGYTSGVSYFDDYKVKGTDFNTNYILGTEII